MIVNGNALNLPIASGSVQCVVTSPPYFGLRDYGIDGQLGLEQTPDAYVANMVLVFREVWRVLKDDGVVWLNLGDSYAGSGKGRNEDGHHSQGTHWKQSTNRGAVAGIINTLKATPGLKPKDLIGIPWRVAFALQADGWYLRSDIIWAKPNPMPESVTDRPTKSFEHVFLLAKSSRYFWDADAVREEGVGSKNREGFRGGNGRLYTNHNTLSNSGDGITQSSIVERSNGKNKRVAFPDDFGFEKAPMIGLRGSVPSISEADFLHEIGICYAATIFDIAQLEHDFSLPPFYSQIRQECFDTLNGQLISSLPLMDRATVLAVRFSGKHMTAKDFLSQLNSINITLIDTDQLKEARRLALLGIGQINADANTAIGIKYTSEISESYSIHDEQYTTIDTNSSSARNIRDVWTIATQATAFAHFATFPEKLAETCIKAGSRTGDIVLDPFAGSGTVERVAVRLGRRSIGTELNYKYIREIVTRRTSNIQVCLPMEAA